MIQFQSIPNFLRKYVTMPMDGAKMNAQRTPAMAGATAYGQMRRVL